MKIIPGRNSSSAVPSRAIAVGLWLRLLAVCCCRSVRLALCCLCAPGPALRVSIYGFDSSWYRSQEHFGQRIFDSSFSSVPRVVFLLLHMARVFRSLPQNGQSLGVIVRVLWRRHLCRKIFLRLVHSRRCFSSGPRPHGSRSLLLAVHPPLAVTLPLSYLIIFSAEVPDPTGILVPYTVSSLGDLR